MIEEKEHIETQILYDGDCPICRHFAFNVKKSNPTYQLLNARESSALKCWVTQSGVDIDNGLVVVNDKQLFYGSEAVRIIARETMTKDSPPLWAYALRYSAVCHMCYPLLKMVRRLLLAINGKTLINRG